MGAFFHAFFSCFFIDLEGMLVWRVWVWVWDLLVLSHVQAVSTERQGYA